MTAKIFDESQASLDRDKALSERVEAVSRQIEALSQRLDAVVENLNKSPIGINSEYILFGRKRVADANSIPVVSMSPQQVARALDSLNRGKTLVTVTQNGQSHLGEQ